MRSMWKCSPELFGFKKRFRENISPSLLKVKGSKPKFYVWNRSAIIPNFYVKKRIGIHTGRMYHSLIVRRFMVGRRFGEFAVTKQLGPSIHLKQTKKQRKGK